MIRGIHATVYVDLIDESVDVRPYFENTYSNEHFVTLLSEGSYPETRSVKSSNFCQIAIQKIPNSNMNVFHTGIKNRFKLVFQLGRYPY